MNTPNVPSVVKDRRGKTTPHSGSDFAFNTSKIRAAKIRTAMAELEIVTDPIEAAKEAQLRYVNVRELEADITRRKTGKDFAYFDAQGKRIRDKATLDRIRSLAIPPPW